MTAFKFKVKYPLLLAPMEDVTDIPFRLITKEYGADFLYTEFASAEALLRNAGKTVDKMKFTETERPIGIQIFGKNTESIKSAVHKAEALKPDLIDINAGCWVRKVAMRGEGAGLLRDLKSFENVVKTAVSSTDLPVTVKTRLGWDPSSIVIEDVARMIEDCGAKALALHCRTRNQGYSGQADWSWLPKVKKLISIPLIGNGDVVTPMDTKRMFETGVDAVMIGRGAIGNPWIFRNSKLLLENNIIPPQPEVAEKVDLCIRHFNLLTEYKGPRGIFMFRKFFSQYLKGIPHIAKVKSHLVSLNTPEEVINCLTELKKQYRK